MTRYKAIEMAELAKTIPGWKELGTAAAKSPLDTELLGKLFDRLDDYAKQNGLRFFQIHYRRIDKSYIAIFAQED